MLLRRQLRKAGLSETTPPDAAQWRAFLERIARTYEEAKLERYTLERSLMISSTEMQGLHDELRHELAETRRLEDQLRQSQKMEAIGQLAGGIAHDFNNLLSAILGYANLIIDDLPPSHPMAEDVVEIRKAGERAAELTRQLLAFSRKQVLQPKTIDLGRIVVDMRGMLRRLVGESFTLTLITEPKLRIVHADPNQIEQVILNLVVNARDALTQDARTATSGEIRIETTNLDVPHATSGELKPGRYVVLTVSDNGVGMDESTVARIFEPFFTTKEVGKGTGLGLSTVFGIVKQSGAHINVVSQPGRGAAFQISFPCTEVVASLDLSDTSSPFFVLPAEGNEGEDGTNNAEQTTDREPLTSNGTLLVVEDEDQVRAVTTAVLRRQGYTVLEAQNAGEAFLICETHPGMIDLMLTDVVMPRMSGPELASRVAVTRPDMKVMFMSGYPRNALDANALGSKTTFLEKPLTPSTLKQRIREALLEEADAETDTRSEASVEVHQVH